jgi:U3 small nucleolar ribonucleoprotein component
MEVFMATVREQLDALRAAVEADEGRRREIVRLQEEKAAHAEEDRLRDEAEAEEDRLEVDEDAAAEAERTAHAQAVSGWESERLALQERIRELEAMPRMSDAESVELDELIARLNSGPPVPPPVE